MLDRRVGVFVYMCVLCEKEQERRKYESMHRAKDWKIYLKPLVDYLWMLSFGLLFIFSCIFQIICNKYIL